MNLFKYLMVNDSVKYKSFTCFPTVKAQTSHVCVHLSLYGVLRRFVKCNASLHRPSTGRSLVSALPHGWGHWKQTTSSDMWQNGKLGDPEEETDQQGIPCKIRHFFRMTLNFRESYFLIFYQPREKN